MIRTCMICGKPFESLVASKKYCSEECADEANKLRSKIRWQKTKEKDHAKNKRMKRRKSNIDALEKEAREKGISYGALQAQKTLELVGRVEV